MKKDLLISIIIPIYNVEKYLEECLDSVISQSYKNLEIILVNDRSPDKSGEIADQYSKKDARIKVIHKKVNEGLNYARRDGFKRSKGEYITFLDSDDLLHERGIETYIQTLLKSNADVAVASFFDFSDNISDITKPEISTEDGEEIRLLNSKDEIIRYALLGTPDFPDANYMTACGKLYARELIENIDWSESNFRSYEDNFWTPQVLMRADRVALIASKLYFYRHSKGSALDSGTLGNRLIGNSLNGRPVGYLEYVSLLYSFYNKLSKKYNIKIDEELQDLYYQRSWNRLCVLIDSQKLEAENNLQYVKEIWSLHQQKDWEALQYNADLSGKLNESTAQVQYLKAETADLYSIRRTAQRLLGNIKRKILKP